MAQLAMVPARSKRYGHICQTCGVPFMGGRLAKFHSSDCRSIFSQQRLRRYRCFRCNNIPQMYYWVRVAPHLEAPLCGDSDECVIAWRPRDGWPNPTTRRLRKERQHDPIWQLPPPPRADALTGEIEALARWGRLKATPDMVPVMQAAIRVITECGPDDVPSSLFRKVPVFAILDLARSLRLTLGLAKEGSLDHHLLTCIACNVSDRNDRRMCPTGGALYKAELEAYGLLPGT